MIYLNPGKPYLTFEVINMKRILLILFTIIFTLSFIQIAFAINNSDNQDYLIFSGNLNLKLTNSILNCLLLHH